MDLWIQKWLNGSNKESKFYSRTGQRGRKKKRLQMYRMGKSGEGRGKLRLG